MSFQLTSSAFEEGQTIPKPFTADGADVSPPLACSAPPEGTMTLALICEDPDAPRGIWVHWVLFNLPAATRHLDEGISAAQIAKIGAKQGRNDFGVIGYKGPAPPRGKPHRYFFRLYALDTALKLPDNATRDQLLKAIQGHVLAEASLMGKYAR